MNEKSAYIVLEIVTEIPKGKVATYSQIAQLAGKANNARQVGKVLSNASYYGKYPCHRVVNSAGRLAPDWQKQRELLKEEGIIFKNGFVDMSVCKWNISM